MIANLLVLFALVIKSQKPKLKKKTFKENLLIQKDTSLNKVSKVSSMLTDISFLDSF